MRMERFELITKLILGQPPLPIGLHAQSDFLNWYSREDSNLQDGKFELPMSAGLHHASRLVLPEGLEPSTTRLSTVRVYRLRHDSNEMNWYRRRDSNPHCLVPKTSASSRLGYAGMVNPAGLEPATCRLGNRVLTLSDI